MCFYGRFNITSTRGYRNIGSGKEYHGGLDIVAVDDKTVRAIADGVCYCLTEKNGFGTYIRQLLPDGRRIYYGHMSKWLVSNGTKVKKGDKIGIMGSTGRSTGAHTHLEIRIPGTSKTSEDIADFCGIDNKIGLYSYYPKDECADKLCTLCGFDNNTKAFLTKYKFGEDLLNKLYCGCVRAKGFTPSIEPIICANNVETKCGLSKATMSYLWSYKYSESLFIKLWERMA